MTDRPRELVRLLELRPHPEGGQYAETFRSTHPVSPLDGRPRRAALTQIYYLLLASEHSRWHRVRSDEVWHHYEGDALELFILSDDGERLHRTMLGPTDTQETRPHCVVPAGHWQAARPAGAYTLAGCTVAPGFEFADFTFMAADPEAAARLRARFPDVAALL